jgi:hypothetical protein
MDSAAGNTVTAGTTLCRDLSARYEQRAFFDGRQWVGLVMSYLGLAQSWWGWMD